MHHALPSGRRLTTAVLPMLSLCLRPPQECKDSAPPGLWEEVGVISLGIRECVHAMLLAMWDADTRRYVAFREWEWLEKRLRPVVKPPAKAV